MYLSSVFGQNISQGQFGSVSDIHNINKRETMRAYIRTPITTIVVTTKARLKWPNPMPNMKSY